MRIFGLGKFGVVAAGLLVFFTGLGSLTALNHIYMERMTASMGAVTEISRQHMQPQLILAQVQLLRSDLAARRYLGRGLRELDASTASLSSALARLESLATAQSHAFGFAPLAGDERRKNYQNLRQVWNEYQQVLRPIVGFKSDAYVETADLGTQLSSTGLALNRALEEAVKFGAANQGQMTRLIGELAGGVHQDSMARASAGRLWLLIGLSMCAALLCFVLAFLYRVSRKSHRLSQTKHESDDILRTVNQGLFLLDKNLKIGSERSEALENIFRRKDFDQLHFTDLLRSLVPEKTLETAAEYVTLLWGERVNEKLIKTINPLSEVEVHFDTGLGKSDTQYLEFDFNRVRSEGSMSRILVTVNDVTRRVELARELQESEEKAKAQLDLLLHILHVEPRQLTSFLEESEVAIKMVNAILKEPAREESAFRAKLDGMFRQVHSVKGEAAALGLKTIEQRAHDFEQALADLRANSKLTGNDFLPLVVKLDELFNHFRQVREMIGKLSDLRSAISAEGVGTAPATSLHTTEAEEQTPVPDQQSPATDAVECADTLIQRPPQSLEILRQNVEGGDLTSALTQLAERIAHKQSKQVEVSCSGLERVPNKYRRAIKEVAIQMVRNSLAHGIETPQERARHNKSAAGSIVIRFEDKGANGCEFICQDDGRGLSPEHLKEKAVERGLLSAEQAASLDERRALSLIFMAGFSTQDEVSADAGRGVGMDIVRAKVQEIGGKIGISTVAGKFLRFRIWLPAGSEAQAA